jgi:predicted Zn finger-like uncharacterized protein
MLAAISDGNMIIRCPSCSTKFDLPASRFDADGTMIKCSACGHDWIEGRAVEVVHDISMQVPALVEPGFEPDAEIRRLVDANREAQERFLQRKRKQRALAAAWFGLAMFAGTPAVFALAFPETVVDLAPATVRAYELMGRKVNVYGLEIRRVDTQHMNVDGQRIIAVKGEIANIAGSARKIPWLRFSLKDPKSAEVYAWTLETNTRPLNPGESTNFVTRVASPPAAASEVEIRFARADEIISNTNHE